MAKIAVLVPRQDMADYARAIAVESGIALHLVKVIDTPGAVDDARNAVEDGANIIVARGLQAQLIMRQTSIPVIEIKLTGQELGLLVQKAKAMSGKERPVIAFVGFRNFFSSMSRFEQLFGISLKIYYAQATDDLYRCVEQAAEDEADVVIGGEIALLAAEQAGLPALFYEATEESVREALYIARRAAYAADMEKLLVAQTETILDTSAAGILKIGRDQTVTMSNRMMDELAGAAVGKTISEAIPALDSVVVDDILQGRQQRLTLSLRLNDEQYMVSAAPIELDDAVSGAIFTFHRLISVSRHDSAALREHYLHGYIARAGFEQILFPSQAMKRQIDLARVYALSKSPVVLYGETGTEKELFAQAIHNNSTRRNQPYLSVSLYSGDPQAQVTELFGSGGAVVDDKSGRGALLSANFGTAVLHGIERLTPRCQHLLLQTMQNQTLARGNIDRTVTVDVRVIATSAVDLAYAVTTGAFSPELYYTLGALSLELPPLRGEHGRIRSLAERHIARAMEQYAKYVSLEDSAWEVMEHYPWKGNLLQLEAFCERLVVGCAKKRIDGGAVAALLAGLYPEVRSEGDVEKIIVPRHPEAVRLAELLEKHGGSRKAVAEELGVSAATLWRRMKKYGVDAKYGI